MNRGPNRLMDEAAKLMTDAVGAAQGAKREVEGLIISQAERLVAQMDLVKRDEFDVVKEMAARARMENEALKQEIDSLRELIGESGELSRKPATRSKSKRWRRTPSVSSSSADAVHWPSRQSVLASRRSSGSRSDAYIMTVGARGLGPQASLARPVRAPSRSNARHPW